jgi:hypothetical protein
MGRVPEARLISSPGAQARGRLAHATPFSLFVYSPAGEADKDYPPRYTSDIALMPKCPVARGLALARLFYGMRGAQGPALPFFLLTS